MAEVISFFQEKNSRRTSNDEELIETDELGWHLVRLKNKKAISDDARLLKHDFDDIKLASRLAYGRWHYVSVRNPNGEPLVTLEISLDEELLVELAVSEGLSVQSQALKIASSYVARQGLGVVNKWAYGFVFTRDGDVLPVDVPHEMAHLRGDLLIENCDNVVMPKKLIVSDAIFIKNSTVDASPIYLNSHAMHVVRSVMPKLGEYVVISGDCGITDNSRLPMLADTLVTKGCLHLDEYTPIEHMPRKMRIGTFLNANDINIQSLGFDVRISGTINVAGSPLAQRVALDAQGRPVYSGEFVEISNPPIMDVKKRAIPRYSRQSAVVGRFICTIGQGAGVVVMHPDLLTFHFAIVRGKEMISVNVPDEITSLFPEWLPDEYRGEES